MSYTPKKVDGFKLANNTRKNLNQILDLTTQGRALSGTEYEFNTEEYGDITVTAENEVEARKALTKRIEALMRLEKEQAEGRGNGSIEEVFKLRLPGGK